MVLPFFVSRRFALNLLPFQVTDTVTWSHCVESVRTNGKLCFAFGKCGLCVAAPGGYRLIRSHSRYNLPDSCTMHILIE